MSGLLTAFQESQILSLFPRGAVITEASYFRDEYLPCPARISVQLPDHTECVVVLRVVRHQEGSLTREAELLPILRDAGLLVPEVRIAPQQDASLEGQDFAVYSFLDGFTCQTLAERSAEASKTAIALVVSAVETLAQLTNSVRSSSVANLIPEITLIDELQRFQVDGNIWLHDSRVIRAIELLQTEFDQIENTVVFTNGDYQPANFLTDGENLTGFVDFEYACYQDFLYGFAKYPIYDLRPLNKAGLISHLLEKGSLSARDFASRLALGCLRTLQREISAEESHSPYSQHIFRLLESSLNTVRNG